MNSISAKAVPTTILTTPAATTEISTAGRQFNFEGSHASKIKPAG